METMLIQAWKNYNLVNYDNVYCKIIMSCNLQSVYNSHVK